MAKVPPVTEQMTILRDMMRQLEIGFEEGEAQTNRGTLPICVVKHGTRHLLVIPDSEALLKLVYMIELEERDGEKLMRMENAAREKFLFTLRRELMEGRSAYRIEFEPPNQPQRLKAVSVEQRLVISDDSAVTVQRFLDAIQELVVLGVRAEQILRATFHRMAPVADSAPSGTTPGPDGMYQ